MLDIVLRQDAEDGMTVGGVVDVRAGEELVDNGFHLVVGEHLAIGDGGVAGQRQRQGVDGLLYRRAVVLGGIGHNVAYQRQGIAVDTRRYGIHHEAAATKVGQLETQANEIVLKMLERGGLGGENWSTSGKRTRCGTALWALFWAR